MTNLTIRSLHHDGFTDAIFENYHPLLNSMSGVFLHAGHRAVETTRRLEISTVALARSGNTLLHFALQS